MLFRLGEVTQHGISVLDRFLQLQANLQVLWLRGQVRLLVFGVTTARLSPGDTGAQGVGLRFAKAGTRTTVRARTRPAVVQIQRRRTGMTGRVASAAAAG